MYDIQKLNIWKAEKVDNTNDEPFSALNITELNLGTRSFNALKRANCNTVQDILNLMGEEGEGLRKIRNLGSRSEKEIIEKLQELKETYKASARPTVNKQPTIIKPAKKIWDRKIEEFQLSNYALTRLKSCGIQKVGDLYATNPKQEPGWYAVRELFGKIPSCR